MEAPSNRMYVAGDEPVRSDRSYVVYWMIAQRRTRYNFALEHAIARARDLDKPLVVVEALSCSYRWASDRMHAFAIDGMRDNRSTLDGTRVTYYPYVEPEKDHGKGFHGALAKHACLYVTDDFPCFHLPKWVALVADEIDVRMEVVDSYGIMPLRAAGKAFARAFDFRRYVHKHVFDALGDMPLESPLKGPGLAELEDLPGEFTKRWPKTDLDEIDLDGLPIDHDVPPVGSARGGGTEARERLDRFMDDRLENYLDRNQPEADAASGLSPWLHWGHISAHEVFKRVADEEGWDPSDVEGQKATGKREGWWGMSAPAEAFLDELVTWREVCVNTCVERPEDYGEYESLPDFAKETLAEHESDERPHVYSDEEFERAQTHDELWNAAQNQLRRDGIIHNYLRMLWGKKILHWTKTPEDALRIMVHLNNKYGIDGRDPNSWGGIMWTLGRYDRPWGPEREIFGKVRYMTSDNTAKKVRVKDYVERYTDTGSMF